MADLPVRGVPKSSPPAPGGRAAGGSEKAAASGRPNFFWLFSIKPIARLFTYIKETSG